MTNGELRAATKYDYRISETAAGTPAFAPLEPTGSFGAFGRNGGGSMGSAPRGLRPLPGTVAGRGSGRCRARSERRIVSPPSDVRNPRRTLEQALRDTAVDDQALVEQPVGRNARALATATIGTMNVFAFGVSRKRMEQAVRELGVPVTTARELDEADAVVTLRNYYRRKPAALRDAESNGIPIYVLKTNTILQMENMLAQPVRPGGRSVGGGTARDGGGDRPRAGSGPADGAGSAERLHPAPAAPDGGAQQRDVALARHGAQSSGRAAARRGSRRGADPPRQVHHARGIRRAAARPPRRATSEIGSAPAASRVVVTREPGGTPLGDEVRRLVLHLRDV